MLLVPLNVEQYHQMIESGILVVGAPVELLDGLLVRKDRSQAGKDATTVGHYHAWVIAQLSGELAVLRQYGCHARIQQPITIPPQSEPEPDVTIARGTPRDFRDGHPQCKDVLCAIEVADSSLRHDRTTKQAIYARAGIPRYLIINLVNRVVEDYQRPNRATGCYDLRTELGSTDTISIEVPAGSIAVRVAALLPE